MTPEMIQLLIAALPGIEALVKSEWDAHTSGVKSLDEAKASIAGGLAALVAIKVSDAAEDAKLHAEFAEPTPSTVTTGMDGAQNAIVKP